MDKKNTLNLLALLICFMEGGYAYGQVNTWQYEKWKTVGDGVLWDDWNGYKDNEKYYTIKGASENQQAYIFSGSTNTFITVESVVTSNPKLATCFTFENEESANDMPWYSISYKVGDRKSYLYEKKGVAYWSDEHSQQWCVQHFDDESTNPYTLWHYDHGDGGVGTLNDPRNIEVKVIDGIKNYQGGDSIQIIYYNRKITSSGDYSDLHFISKAQYDALYPHNLIKESLGYNKIDATGWYYPQGYGDKASKMKNGQYGYYNTVNSYLTSNGTWLAQTKAEPDTTGAKPSHGYRLATYITGLVPEYTYDIEVYAHVTRAVDGKKDINTEWFPYDTIQKKTLYAGYLQVVSGFNGLTNIVSQSVDVKGSYGGENCPDLTAANGGLITLTGVQPDANGQLVIVVGTNSTGTDYVYAAIKSIKHHTDLTTDTFADGTYYLYNPSTDKYLDAGTTWGAQAIVGHGIDLDIASLGDNKYTIDSKINNGGTNEYLNGTYLDGIKTTLYMYNNNGDYTISTNGDASQSNYISADNSTYIVTNAASSTSENAIWNLRTFDQRKLELLRATVDNPKDATFLITRPNFGRHDTRDLASWTGYDASTMKTDGLEGSVNSAKMNHFLNINTAAFDISQTLTDVPNGLYLLSAQGVHNDENDLKPIVELYANDNASPFDNLTGSDMATTTESVYNAFTDGGHTATVLAIVTDNNLKIGARSFAIDGNSGLDNFELTYYGKYDTDNMDVSDLFIKNPGFQDNSNWQNYWTISQSNSTNTYSKQLGNSDNNTMQNKGYFAENTSTTAGEIYQEITLPAGAYLLSADAIAQNIPCHLFVRIGDREQNIVFIDDSTSATYRQTKSQRRKLTFIVPESSTVKVGFRNDALTSAEGFTWAAVDNFEMSYLGKVDSTNISCQIVNPKLDADNQDLPTASYGWSAETGSTGFTWGSGCGERFYTHTSDHLFNTFQTVTGLPDGWYKVTVQGFYRDGGLQSATQNRKRAFLYANNTYQYLDMIDDITPDTELYGTTDGGYPYSMAAAQTAFTKGLYNNEVLARVTDGNLKIGVRKDSYVDWDWAIFDNFTVTYMFSDEDITEGMEFTQFIKNPSFETGDSIAWTAAKTMTVKDNKDKDLMTNGVGRYIANTGSQTKLGYYHLKQTISGATNGLPQGQYVLKAKISSVEDNDIAVFANGRLGSFITDGTNDGREIELGSIGVNNNEAFDISFTSNYGFTLDDLRLIRSSREGEGDALIVDLDGLIAHAKAILESGFVGDGAFQINGDALQTAYEAAIEVNNDATTAYTNKKAAKDALVEAIEAIQVATPKKPDSGVNYMIKHIASGYYLATNGEEVVVTKTPSTIQFIDDDSDDMYTLYDENNGANKYIYKQDNANGPILTANATEKTEIAFRIIFINGIPSHIALTYSGFEDGTCLGTDTITNASEVFCNTDATDGYSRWIITTFDPTIKDGDKVYWYNLEAGAFIDEEAYTPAATDLDGKTVVITDINEQSTLALCHKIHPNVGEQDAFTFSLADYDVSLTGDDAQYIFAKFDKVTDASVSGDNLYTIQMLNANGDYYTIYGGLGYLNFQTAGKNVIFAIGLNSQYGQDGVNCALWEVTYSSGNGYIIKNVGNGGYYNPAEAAPSSTPVYVKLNNKFPAYNNTVFGNDEAVWTLEADGSSFKMKNNINKYLEVANDVTSGIGSYVSTNDNDNAFTITSAGDGYDYNIYTMSIDPSNTTFGSGVYGNTYLGWSGESGYLPVLPLIASDDAEPRGIHWMKCTKTEYDIYKSAVKKARSARMNAWPIVRSAIRNGVNMTEFNQVYNSPLAASADINLAAATLKDSVEFKVLHATVENPYDASYNYDDAECQLSAPADSWTVTGDFTRHENPLYETIDGKKKMVLGGYYYESTTGNAASVKKEITGLTPGKYALALDINATTSGDAPSGLKLYIKSNSTNEQSADVSGVTSVSSTVTTPIIEVASGETVTIGLEIESTNNVATVAFDNFKLKFYDTYREVETTEKDKITTFKMKGIWRNTETAEVSKYVNDKATEKKNVDEAMSMIDMEDAVILDDMDLSFTGPKTGNVLVWTAADAPVTINGKDQNVIRDGKCTKFVVTDNQTLNIPKAFKANEVEYSRKFATSTTNYSYATVLLPFALETNDDYQLYDLVHGNSDGSFYIERVTTSTAGIPSFVRKKDSSATDVTFNKKSDDCDIDVLTTAGIHETEATDDKLKLVGSYVYGTTMGTLNEEGTGAANNYYYLKNDKFLKGNDWFYVDAFRAYIDASEASLSLSSNASFRLIEWDEPEADAIDATEEDSQIVGYYSTNGTPRQCLQKGMNIIKYSDGHSEKVYIK